MNRKWIRLRATLMEMSPDDVLEFDRAQEPRDDVTEVWAQQARAEATACNWCGELGAHEIAGRMIRICAECLPEYEAEERDAEAMDAMVGGEES